MPTQLDPRYAMDAHSSRVGGLVFASLARVGENGGYEPYLAESWRCRTAAGCEFRLRKDFVFHDGSPVTAADIVATYEALMDPALASPRRAVLTQIRSVDAPEPARVRMRVDVPYAAILEAATVPILPARLARAGPLPAGELVGCGPFRLSEVSPDESIRLEAFDRFAEGAPTISAIRFRVVPDELMRAMELVHGTIDFVQNAIDPDTIDWLERARDDLSVLRGPSNNFQYLGMNLDHPALSDVRVRRAIALAIDREAIVRHVLEGQAAVATGLLPPHHWAYDGAVRRYRHDPARAVRLLERAGFEDPDGDGPRPRLLLSYKTTTQELRRRIAEALADQLAAVGIRIEILSYEWGTFYADVRAGNFHLYSLQWVGITDPDIYRQVFHSQMTPPAGHNRGRYSDATMDLLTDRGLRASDPRRRARIYARVQRRAARRLPYVPLWWPQRIVVTNRRLHGFTPHPSGDLFGLRSARLEPPGPASGD